MKKKILFGVLFAAALIATGCGKEETKVLTCTRTATVTTGVKMDLKYKATYAGKYVKVIETEEKVIAENKNYLTTYKTSVEKIYEPYKDVKHYNYDVSISGDTLTSKTKIDYEKIDTDEMIKIDSANASLIKDGKVKIDDVKSLYESLGATCK